MSEMNDELMFSVLVLTYNQENYISQTLDSILNQEHDYKYEIVVGEDCSTDGTRKIVEEYAAKYPEIIKPFYNNPNKGLIKNYFETAAECKGKYIMECAGDDWWLPGKVKTQIEFMENHPDVGMCYGKAKQFLQRKNKIIRKKIGSKKETFEELIKGNDIPALTICMRRIAFEKYVFEIQPMEKDWLMEDYPMWLWFSIKSKIHFMEDTLGAYRVLDNSVSHFYVINDKSIEFIKSVDKIRNYFLVNFCDVPCNDFDIHRELAWLKATNSFYNRLDVIDEIRKITALTRHDNKLYKVCSNPFLFWLLRTRWQFMGVGK